MAAWPAPKDGEEVMQQGDDVRAVRYRPSDGKGYLWDVQVWWADTGGMLVIGCESAAHARRLFGELNNASHLDYTPGVEVTP
jgi:hypothetical protein